MVINMSNKQHFLLSAKARTLSVRQVFELTEQQAFETFKEVRWGKGDNVACPLCGVLNGVFVKPCWKPHWKIFSKSLKYRLQMRSMSVLLNAWSQYSAIRASRLPELEGEKNESTYFFGNKITFWYRGG